MSVLLGNDNTGARLPLRDLRLRFRREPAAQPAGAGLPGLPRQARQALPGQTFALETVGNPWYISMDGKKDVLVEAGAWSLTPGVGANGPDLGRLQDGRGRGKFCLRFWVDLKSTVKKGDVGIREGTRLFFAINVIDKAGEVLLALLGRLEKHGEEGRCGNSRGNAALLRDQCYRQGGVAELAGSGSGVGGENSGLQRRQTDYEARKVARISA